MRAAVQTAIGHMEIREIDVPAVAPGDLLVRVRAALTCGTDRKILDRGHVKFAPPLVMGHEFSGEVARAGTGAPFSEGDLVMGGISGPCGRCAACVGGASNRCSSEERALAWGAFAELVLIPARVAAQNVFAKPAFLSDEAAAILDPLACVAHGIARLPEENRDDILIVGAGAIGLLWVAAAKMLKFRNVAITGKGRERLEAARAMGAEVFEHGVSEPPEARTVVECVGTPAAWEEAFARVKPGGTALFFGGCAPGASVVLSAERLHYEEVTARGAFHYRPEDAREAAEWLTSGKIDPAPLFSDDGDLSSLPGFFDRMRRGEGIKYVIHP